MEILEQSSFEIFGWQKRFERNFDEDEIELFRKVYAEGKAEGEFDIENVEL